MSSKSKKQQYMAAIKKSREYPVFKSNDLIIKSKYNFTLLELKTIAYLSSLINSDDIGVDYQYKYLVKEFEIKDYCKVCGINNSGRTYLKIKNTVSGLAEKPIRMENDERYSVISWFSKADIWRKTGKITVRFDPDILPYLLNLKKQFTSYGLINVLTLKSKYAFRLYELFKCYQYQEIFVIDIKDLRERLGAESKTYDKFSQFKRRVLEPSMKEINEKTDLRAIYEEIRNGHAVLSIRFGVVPKNDHEYRYVKAKANEELNILSLEYPDESGFKEQFLDIKSNFLKDSPSPKYKKSYKTRLKADDEYFKNNADNIKNIEEIMSSTRLLSEEEEQILNENQQVMPGMEDLMNEN